jgi:hypothetical protein
LTFAQGNGISSRTFDMTCFSYYLIRRFDGEARGINSQNSQVSFGSCVEKQQQREKRDYGYAA